jgi:BirA family transcriptional regulator, biotin operon repressor / biotin---[acetyl-CoA-carboxylase] ligase
MRLCGDHGKDPPPQLVRYLMLVGQVQLLELFDQLIDEANALPARCRELLDLDPVLLQLPNLDTCLCDHASVHPLQVSPCCDAILLPISIVVKNPVFAIHRVARIGSTQDAVRRAARGGAAAGYCCVADEQTAGRGRQGRRWEAPAGTALLASVLVRVTPDAATGVPFAAGLAVLDALDRVAAVDARLKWPNDVLAGGGKLAGLLAEVEPGAPPDGAGVAVVVGLGLNLSVDTFPTGARGVSLHRLTTPAPTRDDLLEAWLVALWARARALEADGLPRLLQDWRRRAVGLGAEATAETPAGPVRGVVEEVADDGALLIRTNEGVVRLIAGDVHMTSGWTAPADG